MVWVLAALLVVAVSLLGTFLLAKYLSLWVQALSAGCPISFLSLILMSLRGVQPEIVVKCKVMSVQAGLPDISIRLIEAQVLAEGDVERVMFALIAADRAGIPLDWDTAAAIDLAGRDIVEAVQVSVNPKVIYCPDPQEGLGDTLYGVAKDGIQLKVRVRVTVRTKMTQLVGGATETTVTARVGQAIITAIGSCESYREALGDPMVITRQVIAQSLDSQTAFEIISIDIADIDVGENIGAKLQLDQADADIRIARASAERRRAMAVARQQEMTALTRQNQATLLLAEAAVPLDVAAAMRLGQQRSLSTLAWNQAMKQFDVPGLATTAGLT